MNKTTADAFPMTPWPDLAPFARTVAVPEIRGALYLYDSALAKHGETAASEKLKVRTDSDTASRAPVILIHGLGDEADSWRHLFPILARDRRVLAPDLPGFGRSSASEKISMKTHEAAIRAILAETGPAILIGSSMGAAVAQLAAFSAPELTKALVLIDGGIPSAGGLSSALLKNCIPGVGERGYRAWRNDHDGAFKTLAPYYANMTALPEADKTFLRERVIARVESDGQLRAYFSSFRSFLATAAFRADEFRERLEKLERPMLVIWGAEDRILLPESREPLFQVRPDARDEKIAGAGHLPHQEKPEEVAAILGAFFGTQRL